MAGVTTGVAVDVGCVAKSGVGVTVTAAGGDAGVGVCVGVGPPSDPITGVGEGVAGGWVIGTETGEAPGTTAGGKAVAVATGPGAGSAGSTVGAGSGVDREQAKRSSPARATARPFLVILGKIGCMR